MYLSNKIIIFINPFLLALFAVLLFAQRKTHNGIKEVVLIIIKNIITMKCNTKKVSFLK